MEGRGDANICASQEWEGGEPCGWCEEGRAWEEGRHVQIILIIATLLEGFLWKCSYYPPFQNALNLMWSGDKCTWANKASEIQFSWMWLHSYALFGWKCTSRFNWSMGLRTETSWLFLIELHPVPCEFHEGQPPCSHSHHESFEPRTCNQTQGIMENLHPQSLAVAGGWCRKPNNQRPTPHDNAWFKHNQLQQ